MKDHALKFIKKKFLKIKIYPKKKLINAVQLGKKSIAYHVNPFIKSA